MSDSAYEEIMNQGKGRKSKLRRAKSYTDDTPPAKPKPKAKKVKKKVAVKKKAVVKKKAAVKKKAVAKKKAVVKKKTVVKKTARKTAPVAVKNESILAAEPVLPVISNASAIKEKVEADAVAILEDYDFSMEHYFAEEEQLPSYADTSVTLMYRDPHCIYAYWDITGESVDQMRQDLGAQADDVTYTLRVYDVTYKYFNGMNANSWFDLDGLHMNSRYIDVNDGATYCAEIGVRLPNGRFYSLSRSNFISTPPAGQSNRNELMWIDVHMDADSRLPEAAIQLKKDFLKKLPLHRNTYQINGNRITLSREDIIEYYKSGRSLIELIRQRMLAQGNSDGSLEEFLNSLCIEDASISEITESVYLQSGPIGSSAGFSGDFVQIRKEEKFRFRLETELIIRGETVPGASVYWGGKKIDINDDGTFEIQMRLNDGLIPLEFEAVSQSEALSKTIKTSVIRTRTTSDVKTNKEKL